MLCKPSAVWPVPKSFKCGTDLYAEICLFAVRPGAATLKSAGNLFVWQGYNADNVLIVTVTAFWSTAVPLSDPGVELSLCRSLTGFQRQYGLRIKSTAGMVKEFVDTNHVP